MAAAQVIVAAFLAVTGLVSAQVPFYGGPNYGIGGVGFGYLGGPGPYAHGFGPFTGGVPPYYGAVHSLPWSSPIGGGIGTTHTVSHAAHGTVAHTVGPHVSTSKTVSVHHHPATHVTTVHHPASAVTTHVQHLNSGFPGPWTYPYPGFSPYFPQYPGTVFEHHSPIVTQTSVEKTTTSTTDSSNKDKKANYQMLDSYMVLDKKADNVNQPNTIIHHNPVHTVVTKTHHVPSGYPYNLPGVVSTTHHQTVSHPNAGLGLPAAFPGAFPYPPVAGYPGLDYGHGLLPGAYGPMPGVLGGPFPYLNAGLHGGAVGSTAVHTVHHPGVGIPPLYPGAFGGYNFGNYPFGFSTITSSSTTTTGKDTKSSSGKSTSSSKN